VRNAARRALFGDAIGLAVCRAGDGEPGGSAARDATEGRPDEGEIGFWVLAAYRRQGYARAAVTLTVSWALGPLGLRRVWADVDGGNGKSLALLRAVGFRESGAGELPPGMPVRSTSAVLCVERGTPDDAAA
jgi:RimJ/RimL family protein N-acetyltransferase